jgi:hypothetical protein
MITCTVFKMHFVMAVSYARKMFMPLALDVSVTKRKKSFIALALGCFIVDRDDLDEEGGWHTGLAPGSCHQCQLIHEGV